MKNFTGRVTLLTIGDRKRHTYERRSVLGFLTTLVHITAG